MALRMKPSPAGVAQSSIRRNVVARASSTGGKTIPGVKSYRVSFFDAMKFNGPAPEIVNGRLAMMGLLITANAEMNSESTALQLLSNPDLVQLGVVLMFVYASLVPVMKGVKNEAFGMFSPRAEITNGRAAMLGFAVLLALEQQAGVPFF